MAVLWGLMWQCFEDLCGYMFHMIISYSWFTISNFTSVRTTEDVEASFLQRNGINVVATLKGCLDKGTRQNSTNTFSMCNECTDELQLPSE